MLYFGKRALLYQNASPGHRWESSRWIIGATTFHQANENCIPCPVPGFLRKQIIGDVFDDYWSNT